MHRYGIQRIMHRILITGAMHPVALEILNGARDVQADYRPDLPYDEILPIIGAYQALITRSETRVTRERIDAAPRLKEIARAWGTSLWTTPPTRASWSSTRRV